jgi:hypothetical protein
MPRANQEQLAYTKGQLLLAKSAIEQGQIQLSVGHLYVTKDWAMNRI